MPCCSGFHLDQHCGSAGVCNVAERACDCGVRDAELAPELAKFRDRIGWRERRIVACIEQLRVVRIRVG
jgi:hypothetical protein